MTAQPTPNPLGPYTLYNWLALMDPGMECVLSLHDRTSPASIWSVSRPALSELRQAFVVRGPDAAGLMLKRMGLPFEPSVDELRSISPKSNPAGHFLEGDGASIAALERMAARHGFVAMRRHQSVRGGTPYSVTLTVQGQRCCIYAPDSHNKVSVQVGSDDAMHGTPAPCATNYPDLIRQMEATALSTILGGL